MTSLASVVLLAALSPLLGQEAVVRGRVMDAATSRPVSGAVVRVGDRSSMTSDAAGRFTVTLPAGTALLVVTADGYFTESSQVDVNASGIDLEIRMVARTQIAEGITVTGVGAPISATSEVTPLEVTTVAGAGENIFRVLHTLPGVAAADEFGSRLSVRGGGPDQNLTVMDGIEIYNPYRLFGLTSAFNPETVERFELTAGGFSAKYGDRLSSILVIENRAGRRQARMAGSAALGLTDANIVTEGRLPGSSTGSWLVSGRRTYYDLIAERIVDADLPSFADVQTNVVWEPGAGRRLTVSGLVSREGADAQLDGGAAGERFGLRSDTRNALAAISLSSSIGARGSTKTIVSWYRNREVVDVDADFRNESRRSNRPDDDAVPLTNIAFARTLGVRDLALRQELVIQAAAAHVLEAGFESHALRTDWSWRIVGDRNPHEANGSTMRAGSGLPALLDSNGSARRAGAWLIDRWAIGPRLRTEWGVRIDWSGLAREVNASPRLAATADVGGGIRLRAAAGLFTQSPGYEKLLQSDYFVDLSNAATLRLQSERAWHGIAGLERRLGTRLLARVEGYYKRFDRLIIGRAETPAAVAARVAAYDFPGPAASSVPREARITSVPSNDGEGRAYGIDVYLARPATSAADRLTGWLSYTRGNAETTAYGRRFVFDYDRAHAASLVVNYRLRTSIDLGATVRVQSGFPYTPAVGVRVAAVADSGDADGDGNLTELVPQRDREGLLVWEADLGGVSNLNARRLPVFARVDVRTTFKPRWANHRWQFYLEVINLLNRRNAGSVEPVLQYDSGADRPRVTTTSQGGVPLLPSIGIRYRF